MGRASYCETGRKCCLLEMLPTHSSTAPGNSNKSAYIMYMYDLAEAVVIPVYKSTLRLSVNYVFPNVFVASQLFASPHPHCYVV